jgi:hypothetical protein
MTNNISIVKQPYLARRNAYMHHLNNAMLGHEDCAYVPLKQLNTAKVSIQFILTYSNIKEYC